MQIAGEKAILADYRRVTTINGELAAVNAQLKEALAKAKQAEAIADEEVEFQVKQRIILVERLNEADAKIVVLEGQGGKE